MTQSVTQSRISSAQVRFTTPFINTGKPPVRIPRGSSKLAELAKNKWCVEFYFLDKENNKMVRVRSSKQLNRIKEYREKLDSFSELLTVCVEALNNGWNPLKVIKPIKEQRNDCSDILLSDAIEDFLDYHKSKGNRPKTVSSYKSKLKLFLEHHGNGAIREIRDVHITDFLNTLEKRKKWTGVTYNYARIVVNNLFVYLLRYKNVEKNPATGLESRKEIKTELHQVFSDNDFLQIMSWLRENDPYTLLFVQCIYYTCIRPKELRQTQLKFIDLINNRITIPATVAKNKKAMPVQIDISLKYELIKLKIESYPKEFYLFGDVTNVIGRTTIGVNTPYYRFQVCLRNLKLTGKNYTLYSFKHLSNVRKYLAGWTIAEICAANRHSSLVETETYLKDLIKFIPVTKSVPVI